MIKILELEKDLTDVSSKGIELTSVKGGLGYDNLFGAAAGGVGSGIGQVTSNYLNKQPLQNNVFESTVIGAGFGLINPVNGAATFVTGVAKGFSGTIVGSDIFNPPPAVGSRTR